MIKIIHLVANISKNSFKGLAVKKMKKTASRVSKREKK